MFRHTVAVRAPAEIGAAFVVRLGKVADKTRNSLNTNTGLSPVVIRDGQLSAGISKLCSKTSA